MVFSLPPPQTALEKKRSPFIYAYKRSPAPHPVWTSGLQAQEKSKFGTVAAFGGTLAGLGVLGFTPVGKKRVWDYYLQTIRATEEMSPAKILQTFQYSEVLSPLGSNRSFKFPAELFNYTYQKASKIAGGSPIEAVAPNQAMRRFVSNMLDQPIAQLEELGVFSKGLEFRRKGWMFGEIAVQGGPVISKTALPLRIGGHAGGSFVDWYARLTGVSLDMNESVARISSPGMMAISIPKIDKVLGIPISEIAAVQLQKTRIAGRMARAYAAGQIGRLNRLLAAPADWFPTLSKVLNNVGIQNLTIKPGSALQMLSRYTAKGLAIAGAYKGFQYLSYMRSQTDNKLAAGAGFAFLGGALGGILRHTRRGALIGASIGAIVGTAPLFDQGVIEGAATAYTRAAIGIAKVSEKTGSTESAREQEEFMPGITKAKTVVGFTLSGMMTGLLGGYALKLAKFKKLGISGTTDFMKQQATNITKTSSWLGKQIGTGVTGGLKERILMRGGRIGALLGAGIFGALAVGAAWSTGNVLPGIIGAEKTPEELEKLYTGQEDVAIRRGRWWEFGRCNAKNALISVSYGIFKKAKDITLEDTLLGADGCYHNVKAIFKRHHDGVILKFTTILDRNITTDVTPNHTIGVLKEKDRLGRYLLKENRKYEFTTAEEIEIGDFVQVSVPKLKTDIEKLYLPNLIKSGLFIQKDNHLFPAQINWFSKNLQHSRGTSIHEWLFLTPEIGRLFGYFLAEGSLSFKNDNPNMIETVHAKSEYWIVKDILTICKQTFGILPTVRFKRGKNPTDEGCWIIRICNSLLARVFFELFYKSARQNNKTFPLEFFSAPQGFKNQLIEGYWRGDGHIDRKRYIISGVRKNLIDAVRILLLASGECPTTSVIEDCHYTCQDGRQSMKLRISWTPGLAETSGFIRREDKLFVRIISIVKEDYNDKVYDFEIDNKDHLLTNGTFLVHNSSWEGGRTSHYRPHWYNLLMSKAKIKGLWGSEKEKWNASPMLHPLKALFDEEFKYKWERENYYDRPYPQTGTYGSDVPFIAPIAEALGSLIKPPKLMHTKEWLKGTDLQAAMNEQGLVLNRTTAAENEPAYELGGLSKGTPVSKHQLSQQAGELIYRLNELRGLTGFMHSAVKEKLTGSQDYFDQLEQLETANRAYGSERAYWDKELGGLLGLTEGFRRFLPHRRRQIELYNPIKNTMPDWMPGKEYYLDFQHGDPYTKVPEGEIRLPGRGYTALHPEVTGLSPQEYPLFHRFKILADVAMYSDKYQTTKQQLKSAIERGELNQNQLDQFSKITTQISERKKRKRFIEYRFANDTLESKQVKVEEILPNGLIQTTNQGIIGLGGVEIRGEKGTETYRRKQVQVSDYLREYIKPGMELDVFVHRDPLHRFTTNEQGTYQPASIQLENNNLGEKLVDANIMQFLGNDDPFAIQSKYNTAQKTLGGIWETITHYESPREYLLPLSPKAKFIHHRSAIEEYERSRVWGCLVPGQPIKTIDGYKNIEDIDIGDYVYTDNGNWKPVVNVTSKIMPHNIVLCVYIASLSGVPFVVTPDHQMLIFDNTTQQIVYKSTDTLHKGDKLAYPIPTDLISNNIKTIYISNIINHPKLITYNDGSIKIGSFRYGKLFGGNNSKRIPDTILLQPDFYELIGYYLAEGSVGYQNGHPFRLSLCFHIDEVEYHKKVVKLVKSLFGLTAHVNNRIQHNKTEITINSVPLAMLFHKLCGAGSAHKFISDLLKPASKDCWIALLRGYIRGDGS